MVFQNSAANAAEYFTCPACYDDLPSKARGLQMCACGVTVDCTIEYVPSYVATIVDEGMTEEEFGEYRAAIEEDEDE